MISNGNPNSCGYLRILMSPLNLNQEPLIAARTVKPVSALSPKGGIQGGFTAVRNDNIVKFRLCSYAIIYHEVLFGSLTDENQAAIQLIRRIGR